MVDQSLIDGVRDFVERELVPTARAVDREREFPADRWEKLGEHGLTGLVIPTSRGGIGADSSTWLAAMEALAGGCASTAWALLAHSTVATGILALGTEAQKEHYLPALASARLIGGTLAATETGGGSNAASIRTFARREGEDYILDGGKFFITQAGVGDVFLVIARTETAIEPGSLSCFLVEKNDPGLRFGEREETMGLRGVPVREIFFDSCRVPADRLLGKPGAGLDVVGAVSATSVFGAAAGALGLAQAAMTVTVAHLRERTIVDQPMARIPTIQAQMARVALDLEGARAWLASGLAWLESGARGVPLPMWLGKVAITEAAARVIDRCLRLHGAAGYSQALPLERYSRDVRAFAIHWGNNDVLMDVAGKTVLAS